MKAYSTKSTARRAAKQQFGSDAIEGQHYELVAVGEQFAFRSLVSTVAEEVPAAEAVAPEPEAPASAIDPVEQAEAGEPAPASDDEAMPAPATDSKPRNKSTVASPVRQVWAIADSMPGAKRKDIVAACVEQGIAFFTARTQYQKWNQARRAETAQTDGQE